MSQTELKVQICRSWAHSRLHRKADPCLGIATLYPGPHTLSSASPSLPPAACCRSSSASLLTLLIYPVRQGSSRISQTSPEFLREGKARAHGEGGDVHTKEPWREQRQFSLAVVHLGRALREVMSLGTAFWMGSHRDAMQRCLRSPHSWSTLWPALCQASELHWRADSNRMIHPGISLSQGLATSLRVGDAWPTRCEPPVSQAMPAMPGEQQQFFLKLSSLLTQFGWQ